MDKETRDPSGCPVLPIDGSEYQVFLLSCPAALPLSFALHTWFIVHKKGEQRIFRWEVLMHNANTPSSWGHLCKDYYPSPVQGIRVISSKLFRNMYWKKSVNILGAAFGNDEGSTAFRMIKCIEESPHTYPYLHRYSLTGPNSNTYVQWVLDRSPEANMELPREAFGKDWKEK